MTADDVYYLAVTTTYLLHASDSFYREVNGSKGFNIKNEPNSSAKKFMKKIARASSEKFEVPYGVTSGDGLVTFTSYQYSEDNFKKEMKAYGDMNSGRSEGYINFGTEGFSKAFPKLVHQFLVQYVHDSSSGFIPKLNAGVIPTRFGEYSYNNVGICRYRSVYAGSNTDIS
jgi:hypothetical protein